MEEFSLSNALLDPGIFDNRTYTDDDTDANFPALVYHEPYQSSQAPTVLFKPPTKKVQKQDSTSASPTQHSNGNLPHPKRAAHKKSWDGVISEFFSKKKKGVLKGQVTKHGTLSRSRSWNALHKKQKEEVPEPIEKEPKTFVYKPKRRRTSRGLSSNQSPTDEDSNATSTTHSQASHFTTPEVPLRDSQLTNENAGIYEVPITLRNPPKVNGSSSPKPVKPPRQRSRGVSRKSAPVFPYEMKRHSFIQQDLIVSHSKMNEESRSRNLSGNIGMLKIRVLAVRIPQVRKNTKLGNIDSDDEDEPIPVVMEISPKDGLFCILSINGKQSRFESSLQPLNPIKHSAIWDQTESEAVFYTTHNQQLFVMSRKLPLADVTASLTPLSQKPKAECFGVGIYPLSNLKSQKVSNEDGSIENWINISMEVLEVTVPLQPLGSVLLGISYTNLHPHSPVSCTGTVTIKSLTGVDCFRNETPCWTCCTIDIDSENYGTTPSILGMDDFLSKGWTDDPIDFDADSSTFLRIQIWGFGEDDTEYWFGEIYIPIAMILPYSKQIVHQDGEDSPLQLLEGFDREITMPVEPRGAIELVFHLSPSPEQSTDVEDNVISEETIRILEESGVFTPQTIAHLRNESGKHEVPDNRSESVLSETLKSQNNITTIPEETSLNSTTSSSSSSPSSTLPLKHDTMTKKQTHVIQASGAYDHLDPKLTTPSPTPSVLNSLSNSLKDKKLTMRLLGSLRLQVPKAYNEHKFRATPDNFDPYREIEILKVDLRDVKAQLAETQFYREKAELEVKMLRQQVEMWKQKHKQKTKKKKN